MIRPSSKTEVKTHIDLHKISRQLEQSYVTVGLHEDAGSYEGGPTVVEVGFWNEFGTETSPERSFLRSAVYEGRSDINKWREELLGKVLSGKMPVEKALSALGLRVQLLIQNKIKSNVPPKLADETARRKRRDGKAPVTLIDSGLMLRSVTYKVVMND